MRLYTLKINDMNFEERLNSALGLGDKFEYAIQCDNLRTIRTDDGRVGCEHGEAIWQLMMESAKKIDMDDFLSKADIWTHIDMDDYDVSEEDSLDLSSQRDALEAELASDPDSACYESKVEGKTILFFQTAGFEMIFTESGQDPREIISKKELGLDRASAPKMNGPK